MGNYKLPIRKWYLAMAFMSFSKKGISATELQRQIDHSRYETVWVMMHKIREAMGKRDGLYGLGEWLNLMKPILKRKPAKKKNKTSKEAGEINGSRMLQ